MNFPGPDSAFPSRARRFRIDDQGGEVLAETLPDLSVDPDLLEKLLWLEAGPLMNTLKREPLQAEIKRLLNFIMHQVSRLECQDESRSESFFEGRIQMTFLPEAAITHSDHDTQAYCQGSLNLHCFLDGTKSTFPLSISLPELAIRVMKKVVARIQVQVKEIANRIKKGEDTEGDFEFLLMFGIQSHVLEEFLAWNGNKVSRIREFFHQPEEEESEKECEVRRRTTAFIRGLFAQIFLYDGRHIIHIINQEEDQEVFGVLDFGKPFAVLEVFATALPSEPLEETETPVDTSNINFSPPVESFEPSPDLFLPPDEGSDFFPADGDTPFEEVFSHPNLEVVHSDTSAHEASNRPEQFSCFLEALLRALGDRDLLQELPES